MRFRVTAKDIKEGDRADCNTCPVARAASRRLNRQVAVIYNAQGKLILQIGGKHYALPERIISWIRRYDTRAMTAPTSFDVDIPESLSL